MARCFESNRFDFDIFKSAKENFYFLEKEAVRQLITSALKGLEESGRIEPTAYFLENTKNTQVNLDTLSSLISDNK